MTWLGVVAGMIDAASRPMRYIRTVKTIHVKLLAMALFWATSYPLGRYLAPLEAPLALVMFRLLPAVGLLLLICYWRRELRLDLARRHWRRLVVLGACAFCVHNFLLFKALEYTQASIGAVIMGAVPILIITFDMVFLRRRLGPIAVTGVALSFIGAAIVVAHGDLQSLLNGDVGYGEFLFLLAMCGWATYTIAARPLLDAFPPVTVTAYAAVAATVLLLPVFLHDLEPTSRIIAEPQVVLALLLHGVLTISLGFLWYYEGVKALGATNAALYINLVTVFGVSLAVIIIGEALDYSLLLGGVLVVGGMIAVNRSEALRGRDAGTDVQDHSREILERES